MVGAQNSLFLDLSATLYTAYWWLLECHLTWFLRGQTLWCFSQPWWPVPISLHGSSSSHCSPNIRVSQGSVFAFLLYPYLFWGEFHGFKFYLCVNTSKSYVLILDLSPDLQTHVSNCLLNISLWIYVSQMPDLNFRCLWKFSPSQLMTTLSFFSLRQNSLGSLLFVSLILHFWSFENPVVSTFKIELESNHFSLSALVPLDQSHHHLYPGLLK